MSDNQARLEEIEGILNTSSQAISKWARPHMEWLIAELARVSAEHDDLLAVNESVRVCADPAHHAEIVNGGRCVICELEQVAAEHEELREALRSFIHAGPRYVRLWNPSIGSIDNVVETRVSSEAFDDARSALAPAEQPSLPPHQFDTLRVPTTYEELIAPAEQEGQR